jgi:hypothetical protein
VGGDPAVRSTKCAPLRWRYGSAITRKSTIQRHFMKFKPRLLLLDQLKLHASDINDSSSLTLKVKYLSIPRLIITNDLTIIPNKSQNYTE